MNVLWFGRLRVLAYVVALLGLVSVGRSGAGLAALFLGLFGAALVALALHLLGASLEEAGRVVRIRFGAAARVAGATLLAGSTGVALERSSDGLAASGASDLAIGLLALAALVAVGFAARDARVARDARAGQRLRLHGVSSRGIDLVHVGARVCIPLEAVEGVSLVRGARGRGALLRIDPGTTDGAGALPVSQSDSGELLLELTEHEAGVDADVLATRIRSLSARGPAGYR
jgi:hypothetical protein